MSKEIVIKIYVNLPIAANKHNTSEEGRLNCRQKAKNRTDARNLPCKLNDYSDNFCIRLYCKNMAVTKERTHPKYSTNQEALFRKWTNEKLLIS